MPTRVLLIEDNPGDAKLVETYLDRAEGKPFALEWVARLSAGLERLGIGGVDVVLLDLSLPDSHGLQTYTRAQLQAPGVPFVVLSGVDDERIALEAMRTGAQDYLVKAQVNTMLLVRSIQHAIERHRLLTELSTLSLIDDLTGLYNRRGFLTLGDQQLKVANREKRGMLLLFIDLDNMKLINDTHGHREGDRALIETAVLLKETFRQSDIVARIGGDEFVVLALETTPGSAQTLSTRLKEHLEARNEKAERPFRLSMSVGMAIYDADAPCSIHELLARGDALMYEDKRAKHQP